MLAWLVLASTFWFSATPSSDAHVLDVPYRNQLDGSPYALANCGPAALAMAAAYYGVDASSWDLRVAAMQAQHSWVTDDGGYSDRYGVFIYNLATVAEELGLHANGLWDREGGHSDALHRWQAFDLRREIQANHPVIVEVEYRALPGRSGSHTTDDHFIVVDGVDGDDFVYSDPLGFGDDASDAQISERDLMMAMDAAEAARAAFAVVKPAT